MTFIVLTIVFYSPYLAPNAVCFGYGGWKLGDINRDGNIDEYDFSLLAASWNRNGSNMADLNNDAIVNEYDFSLLMANWGL
mgnify:CR=1 FL=1